MNHPAPPACMRRPLPEDLPVAVGSGISRRQPDDTLRDTGLFFPEIRTPMQASVA